MVANGHEVLAIAPEDDPEVRAELAAMGIAFHPVRLHRAGMNPLRDSLTVGRPDPDPAPVPRGRRPGDRRQAGRLRLDGGAACAGADARGHDHRRRVRAGRRRGATTRAARVAAADAVPHRAARGPRGVLPEPGRRAPVPRAPPGRPRAAPRPDRGLGDRPGGVHAGAAAGAAGPLPDDRPAAARQGPARVHRGGAPGARGPSEPSRSPCSDRSTPTRRAITAGDLDRIGAEGVVEYLGVASDVRPHIAAAHVIVLPSYREGTPRSLLEGDGHGASRADNGRARLPRHGRAGAQRPAGSRPRRGRAGRRHDRAAGRPGPARGHGPESRRIAEERYDVHEVDRAILGAMGLLAT